MTTREILEGNPMVKKTKKIHHDHIAEGLRTLAVDITTLRQDPANARLHNDQNIESIMSSLSKFGQRKPVVVNKRDGIVEAGNGTLQAAKSLGWSHVAAVFVDDDPATATGFAIADNRTAELATWDEETLGKLLESIGDEMPAIELGFSDEQLAEIMAPLEDEEGEDKEPSLKLSERFGVPPFSVLDARQGYWQDRKREWLSKGIDSASGRQDNLIKNSKLTSLGGSDGDSRDTSTFDPVLCELSYTWFSPEGGVVLDPFAGGSVRGIVSALLGRKYYGNDISEDQVIENRKQWASIGNDDYPAPTWTIGDSRASLPDIEADLVFSCPPYFDLEVYSDDPADVSSMDWDSFRDAYKDIIKKSCDKLKDNRFAVFVVGEVRMKRPGYYRGFVQETIEAFTSAGLEYYNEAILVTPTGTLQMRTAGPFNSSRKIGKTHQNVLVFVKGDPFIAAKECGVVSVVGAL